MSTASIRKPFIVTSEQSAKIVADVLEQNIYKNDFILRPSSVREENGNSVRHFLETVK